MSQATEHTMEHIKSINVSASVLNSLLKSTSHNLATLIIWYIFVGFVSIFGGTFLITTCRFHLGHITNPRNTGKEPPTLPYFIPWVGSALSMISDPHGFYELTMAKSPNRGPVRIRLGSIHMYMIMGADNIQAIFRNSKHLSFEFMQIRIAQKVKGLPAEDASKLSVDVSGTGSKALVETPADARIWHNLHSIYLSNLTEPNAVNFLTSKFISEFSKQLDHIPFGESRTLPIYAFLQQNMFTASTTTLAGPQILKHSTFVRAFWDYDAAFMTLMQGTPRFIYRKGWEARDQCLEATKKWLASARANVNWETVSRDNPDWEENFGHRLLRQREESLVQYGISFEGRASMHMGLIWAINANAIPMAAYMLIEIIRSPILLHRVREELSAAMVSGTKSCAALDIDIRTLASLPLLNSIYNECLRLRSSIPISRRLRNDIEIDGYTLCAGNYILAPSWLSHVDESVWASPEHPAREFWAERFMQKERAQTKLGDFCPYGGGSVICPGRFFAKHEILAAVAMVVTAFDLEFVKYVRLDGADSERGPGMQNAESRGIVSLDRDVVVTMRKRMVGKS